MKTSIIVPLFAAEYRRVEWFSECLDSAFKQADEIIVWDDHSPDEYLDEIKAICGRYNNVRLYRGDSTSGPSYARNRAAELANGEFIFPLDGDDILPVGALDRIRSLWRGRPIYTDIAKFWDEDEAHYQLLDWCDHILAKVGIATVSVLHLKEQWKSIGGWNEGISLYEDGEYNARLFMTFCADHVHEPLLKYRIHKNQRSQNITNSKELALRILTSLKQYDRRVNTMSGCCNKRRTPSSHNAPAAAKSAVATPAQSEQRDTLPRVAGSSLPMSVSSSSVQARYIGGKGKGKHYYRGPVTKFAYKVTHGDVVNVDPRDADANETVGRSMFIAVNPSDLAPAKAAIEEPSVTRQPVIPPARRPRGR